MKKKPYDMLICGGGAAGLILAYRLHQDPHFKNHTILILDSDSKNANDRTWSFWEQEEGPLESIVKHQWNHAVFKAPSCHQKLTLDPYSYKMIQGIDFYNFIHPILKANPSIEFLQTKVTSIESEKKFSRVHTEAGSFEAPHVFSSLYNPNWVSSQKRYPVLQQHFLGWVVETETNCFEAGEITFMDFDIPESGETRFMYVLPFSSKRALLEDTFFSATVKSKETYETAIKNYLKKIDAGTYRIVEKEQGSIPMTAYPFHQHNTSSLLHIGTAGGWTKASTGYTFQNTLEQTERLVSFLKSGQALNQFHSSSKFAFYDLLFLDVLARYNADGQRLFQLMFQNNPVQRIFKFLSNKTSFLDDIRIMRSFPISWFLSALWKRLFYSSR